ncbi:hypothetical protein [Spongiibacter sp. UBA1325]|uniref:hypothetical protein n=1 Tax=Spongiibacter sp. UBA1325 TaxID=1947543 RepID=UPI0025810244|nr:hypothetical protein [Spongiibacter sp. UBA1325]|tara:strand:- start:10752 stop:11225 length:474 start_codon:yes stop_codon:yes gene_type:complete
MDIADYAAWWGAFVATGVFLWDIVKWNRERNNLYVNVIGDMQEVIDGEGLREKLWIHIELVNNSSRSMNITHIQGAIFRKWTLFPWRRRAKMQFILPNPHSAQSAPFVLAPGERWAGMADQEKLIDIAGGHQVWLGASVAGVKRSYLKRLKYETSNK